MKREEGSISRPLHALERKHGYRYITGFTRLYVLNDSGYVYEKKEKIGIWDTSGLFRIKLSDYHKIIGTAMMSQFNAVVANNVLKAFSLDYVDGNYYRVKAIDNEVINSLFTDTPYSKLAQVPFDLIEQVTNGNIQAYSDMELKSPITKAHAYEFCTRVDTNYILDEYTGQLVPVPVTVLFSPRLIEAVDRWQPVPAENLRDRFGVKPLLAYTHEVTVLKIHYGDKHLFVKYSDALGVAKRLKVEELFNGLVKKYVLDDLGVNESW